MPVEVGIQRVSDAKDDVERFLPMSVSIIFATGLLGSGLSGDCCCCSVPPSSAMVVGEVKPVTKLC